MTNRKDMTSDQTTFFPSDKSYTSGNNTSDDGGSSRPSAHASGMAAPSIIENRRNIASSQASLQSDSQSAESLATSFSLFSNRTVRNFVWMSLAADLASRLALPERAAHPETPVSDVSHDAYLAGRLGL